MLGDEDATLAAGSNSHGANHREDNHVAPTDKPAETGHKKEKSVLQAKLTKLAIQVRVQIS